MITISLHKFQQLNKIIITLFVIFLIKQITNNYGVIIDKNQSYCTLSSLTHNFKGYCNNYLGEVVKFDNSNYNLKILSTHKNFIPFLFYKLKFILEKPFIENGKAFDFINTIIWNNNKITSNYIDLYKRVGIYHVLVISSFHILILDLVVKKILFYFKVNSKNTQIISLIICVFYLFIAKVSVPLLKTIIDTIFKIFEYEFQNNWNKLLIPYFIVVLILQKDTNVLSFLLCLILSISIKVYKTKIKITIFISIILNIILYKFNHYINLTNIFYSEILTYIFEIIMLPISIFFVILYYVYPMDVVVNNFELIVMYFNNLCKYADKHFNIVIYNVYFLYVLVFVLIIATIANWIYENKKDT